MGRQCKVGSGRGMRGDGGSCGLLNCLCKAGYSAIKVWVE